MAWRAYLGACLFAAITLLGVKDIDFFSHDSTTELPLIGVSVPVTSFFWAGALLLAIVYCYLHVFLEQLWVELAAAPARLSDGSPIAQHIHPWLISECALIIRRWRGEETLPPIEVSPLGYFGVLASVLLGWLAGPFVLFFFWLWSQPAHNFLLTLICAMAFWAALWAMLESWHSMNEKMGNPGANRLNRGTVAQASWRRGAMVGFMSLLVLVTLTRTVWDPRQNADRHAGEFSISAYLAQFKDGVTWEKLTTPVPRQHFFFLTWREVIEDIFRPVPPQMAEAALVELPSDWQTRATAMNGFFAEWCQRPDTAKCDEEIDIKSHAGFQSEWNQKRATYLRALKKANLAGRDLSFANLSQSHLPGLDLRRANLKRANLSLAQMEGADLRGAHMDGANLRKAQMEGADLSLAQMEGANLGGAQLEGADLGEAQLKRADLSLAQLEGADLGGAQLEGADLSLAQMEGADLRGAHMEGADLRGAHLEGANFWGAHMEGADLSYSYLAGRVDQISLLQSTNLKASIINGSALRFVDLSEAIVDDQIDWRNSFGDGSVILPKTMARPCQWRPEGEAPLTDEVFFGHWRGWFEMGTFPVWSIIAPEGFEDVTPIPPPEGCVWKTEPIKASQP